MPIAGADAAGRLGTGHRERLLKFKRSNNGVSPGEDCGVARLDRTLIRKVASRVNSFDTAVYCDRHAASACMPLSPYESNRQRARHRRKKL